MRRFKALWFASYLTVLSVTPLAVAQSGKAPAPVSSSKSPAPPPAVKTEASGAPVNKTQTPAPPAAAPGATATPARSPRPTDVPAGAPPLLPPSGSASTTQQAGAVGMPSVSPVPGPGTATATAGALDGSTYVVRLRDLEQHIDELKEQIRRSHTRLSLLSDTILSGGVGGARVQITFRNDLSSAFRMTGAVLVLDGAVQYNKQDSSETSSLAVQREIPIFSGSVPPGDHTLQVLLKVRGHGYGVFSYLRGYQFEIKTSHSFTLTEGKTMELEVVAYEKGDLTTPLEQRPAVRFTQNLKTGVSGGGDKLPASTNAPKLNLSTGVSVGAGGK